MKATSTSTDVSLPTQETVSPIPSGYTSADLGIALDVPDSWFITEDPPEPGVSLLLTTYDPVAPPHKLEWDAQTVSISLRRLPAQETPESLEAWVAASKAAAAAGMLEVFAEQRLALGGRWPAARLTLVSGSGGIIEQVLAVVDGGYFEIQVQGNFDLALAALDTIQPRLKPADSVSPAAGMCGLAQGEIVAAQVGSPDNVPIPRCVQALPSQRLAVENIGGSPVRVQLAGFEAVLQPGEKTLFDRAFGEYLAPGVHNMLNGPEIFVLQTAP